MNIFLRCIITYVCMLSAVTQGAAYDREVVVAALQSMMETYPKSTLLDIYKSAFQNRYGPGHIISNPDKAKAYLDWELAQPFAHENAYYEPTICDGSFVRVNLTVITDSIVPYDTYFDAFLQSAESIEMPSIDTWQTEWHEILDVVCELYPQLPNLTEDSLAIQSRLDSGVYQGEHSRQYVKLYDPHYRIIKKEIFDKYLKSLIDNYLSPGQCAMQK